MKLGDDIEEGGNGLPIVYMAMGGSVFIFLVLLIVLALNKENTEKVNDYFKYPGSEDHTIAEDITGNIVVSENKRVASDLDIWDMYPKEDKKKEVEEDTVSPTLAVTPSPTISPDITPDYNDGKHVKITYKDGSEEWVAINDSWDKNNYDFTNLVNSGGILKYMSDGKNVAFSGIDVSKYQKDVDFNRVKAQDISFVMIRVGSRGYKNGEIAVDDYFETNYQKAVEAGLDVGVYFYSQAVTVAEAEEEAQFVLNSIAEKKITYPIAFDMEYVDNDTARIDTLTKLEKTQITSAFVNKIKEAGYRPMIYGDKDWLLKRIEVNRFDKSSIWLAQRDDTPDYPYLYDMWQYSTSGELYGIEGYVDLNICFVDYSAQ